MLFNKRMTGYANLLSKRGRVFRPEYLGAVLDAAAAEADQLVVTGDITNLSLEGEYEEAFRLLSEVSGKIEVTVVPGNHDIYLPITLHERRFPHHFDSFMQGDLPELELDLPAGRFPTVKLRGAVAIVGLSSAVPRPPFISAGYLGREQLDAFTRVLEHPEVAARTVVVLVHHSPFDARFRIDQLQGGLVDARRLRRALQPLARGLLLYGHIHVRRHDRLETSTGAIEVVCASGATLDHADPRVRAGYNLYEIDDAGRIVTIETRVLEPSTGRFVAAALPVGGVQT